MNFARGASVCRTRVQILLWQHGWVWPIAVVLAVLAVSLHVFVVDPGRAAIAAARTELERESAAAQHRIGLAPPATEQQQLQLLQNLLRQSPEADELVRRMAALAQAEQIALAQGDYQQQFHSTTQVLQVHITQPVRASYPQLRRYIDSVLRSIPNASLDQIAARRDNVGQAQLETRLRWSFWMQRVVSAAAPAKAPPKEAMR